MMNKRVTRALIHLLQLVLATAGDGDRSSDGGLRDLLSKPYESHFRNSDLLSDLTDYGPEDFDAPVRSAFQNAITRNRPQTQDSFSPAAKFNFPRQQYYYQPSIYRVPTTTQPTTTEPTTTSTSTTSPSTSTSDCTTPPGSMNHYVTPNPTCQGNGSSNSQPGGATPQPSGTGTQYTVMYPPVTHMQPHIIVAPQIVMPPTKSDYSDYYYDGYDCACY